MRLITSGTPANGNIGGGFVSVPVDLTNTTETLTADARLSASVKIGNTGNLLAGGEVLVIRLKVTRGGVAGYSGQEIIDIPSGQTEPIYHTLKSFDALSDDVIEVQVKSTAVGDSAVSCMAWLNNHSLLPTDAVDAIALKSDAVDLIWAKTMSDLSSVPAYNASALAALNLLFMALRNKVTSTSSEMSIKKNDGTTEMAGAAISDDDTTFTKNELI